MYGDQDFDTYDTFDDVSFWEDYAASDWDEGDAAEVSPVGGED